MFKRWCERGIKLPITGRFDTNSRSEIAQNFRSLQVKSAIE